MNKEEMNKYAYECMVKNNPDEAIKTLIMYDKKLNNRFMKNGVFSLEYDKETLKDLVLQLQDIIDKAIEYIKDNYSNPDGTIWHEDIEKILNILNKEGIE